MTTWALQGRTKFYNNSGAGWVNEENSDAETPHLPSGLQANDVVFFALSFHSTAMPTLPAGWTIVYENYATATTTGTLPTLVVGRAIYDGVTLPGIDISPAEVPVNSKIIGLAYRDTDGGSPSFRTLQSQVHTSNVTDITLDGGVTTTDDNELIVVFGSQGTTVGLTNINADTDPNTASGGTDTVSAPSSAAWTTRFSGTYSATGSTNLMIADAKKSPAGSTGTIHVTAGSARQSIVLAQAVTSSVSGGPSLSGASGSATGETTATGAVTTNRSSGTLYVVATTSTTKPSVAQVKAGQTSTGAAAPFALGSGAGQAVSAVGSQTWSATGLTTGQTYYYHIVHTDSGGDSTVATSNSFTPAAADTAAPVYTVAPAISSIGGTSANLTASINETGDIFYVIVPQAATTPSVSEVIAGTAAGGGAATDAGSALAGTTLDDLLSGLTAGTAYKAVVVARDDEPTPNVQSAVTVVNFTTAGSDGVLTSSLLQNGSDVAIADGTNVTVKVISMTTGTDILKVDTTVTSQRVIITSGAIETGTLYGMVVLEGGVNIAAETLTAT